jgi:hypothetical protein
MPFVRISHRSGVTDGYWQGLSDGVQEAMESTVNVPPHDRFHILTENDLADWSFGNGEPQYVR